MTLSLYVSARFTNDKIFLYLKEKNYSKWSQLALSENLKSGDFPKWINFLKDSEAEEDEELKKLTIKARNLSSATLAHFSMALLTIFVLIFYTNFDSFIKKYYSSIKGRKKLVHQVKDIMNGDSAVIHSRRNISKLYTLADIYAEENNDERAMVIYKNALTGDPTNFNKKLKFAELLAKNHEISEAKDILLNIIEFSENQETYKGAKELLNKLQITTESKKQVHSNNSYYEIVIYPVGNPDRLILLELAKKLSEEMSMNVSVSDIDIPIVENKRSKQLIPYFLKDFIRKLNFKFLVKTTDLKEVESNHFQYDIDMQIRQMIKDIYPDNASTKNKVFLGVTNEDLYAKGINFTFGGSLMNYGLISYKRFSSDFTKEHDNRPRLIERLLKQAMSTTNFLLGVPRCQSSYCVRAYPHSLQEHDEKSSALCEICKRNLDLIKEHPENFEKFLDQGNEFIQNELNATIKEGLDEKNSFINFFIFISFITLYYRFLYLSLKKFIFLRLFGNLRITNVK